MEEVQQKEQQEMAQQAEMEALRGTPAILKAPAFDPTKNPQLAAQQPQQQPPQQ